MDKRHWSDEVTNDEVIAAIRSVPCHFVDYTVTAANVVPASDAQLADGTSGEAITAGDALYIDASASNVLKKADANLSSAAATVRGIAVNSAPGVGQPVKYVTRGRITFNAAFTAADIVILSANAGKIAPAADLASGWRATTIGIAISTTVLEVLIHNSDTVK